EAPPPEDARVLGVPGVDTVAADQGRLAPPSRSGSCSPSEITLVGRGSRPASIAGQEVEDFEKMDVCEAADQGEWALIEAPSDEPPENGGTPKPQPMRPELTKLAFSGTTSSLTITKPPTPIVKE